jgi:hypothetical protein
MATNINTILSWFKTGLKPTQAQFWATWQSFWHKDELIPQSNIADLAITLNSKVEKSQFEGHQTDSNAHQALFDLKANKTVLESYTLLGGYMGTALDLNNRIDAIESPDALLISVPTTVSGSTITFPANSYQARINQKYVINSASYSTTITAAANNYHRTDLIELTSEGTFNKIIGEESLVTAVKPIVSANAVEVTSINIFGAIVGEPTEPFDSSELLQKGGYAGTAKDLDLAKQDISNQIEVGTNQSISTSWHGKTVFFTANCTITVSASLIDNFIFNGITLPGVTVIWAIIPPHSWLFGTPAATTEKQIFTLTKRGGTNDILLLGV